ncbi:DUF155 domain-containing protein [Psidium guajava]|nr:DUF155 domain-containing protein [Psidium guajava]
MLLAAKARWKGLDDADEESLAASAHIARSGSEPNTTLHWNPSCCLASLSAYDVIPRDYKISLSFYSGFGSINTPPPMMSPTTPLPLAPPPMPPSLSPFIPFFTTSLIGAAFNVVHEFEADEGSAEMGPLRPHQCRLSRIAYKRELAVPAGGYECRDAEVSRLEFLVPSRFSEIDCESLRPEKMI